MSDRLAFWASAGITFLVYLFSLAPSVGLEDSGELAVAADGLGVPHPPGYPLWTMISWVFCRVFGWLSWRGYPNPALAISLGSAVMGALAAGVTAYLIARSGRDLLQTVSSFPEKRCRCFAWVCGLSASLAFALSPVMWSQAVIVEVYALGALFLSLTLLLTYLWLRHPCRKTLVLLGLVFGLGLTNYQVLLLAALPIGLVVMVRRWRLGVSFLAAGIGIGLTLFTLKVGTLPAESRGILHLFGVPCVALALLWWLCKGFRRTRRFALTVSCLQVLLLVLVASGVLPVLTHPTELIFWVPMGVCLLPPLLAWRWLVQGRTVAWTYGAIFLGLSIYLYMPLVSDLLNPAMNWGYPRTWEGFCRAITREQYEAIVPVASLGAFGRQLCDYFSELRAQFSLPVIVMAFTGTLWLVWQSVRMRRRDGWIWLGSTLLFFVVMAALLIALANPTGDLQDAFIQKVKFISSHGIFALWIGYGLMGLAAAAERVASRKLWLAVAVFGTALIIPLIPVCANAFNRDLIRTFGAAEQTGHDYGWQFGAYMLNGVPTISQELSLDEEPLPDPFYPPPMEEGAVLFGGTDPGRFVPTYLVYAADFRSDLFVFTQNALADPTYMHVERDHYGDELWVPTDYEVRSVAEAYVGDVVTGRRPNTGTVQQVNGVWQIVGQHAIMELCALLAEQMFTHNSERAFYIEESHPMRWTEPYVEPAGFALHLNRKGGNVKGLKTRDMDFWDRMTRRLLASPGYRRDVAAQKSFTQLRLAYGRVYGLQNMFLEEGRVYQDALALYPLSFATVLRYAQWKALKPSPSNIYDAARMVRRFREIDPNNEPTRQHAERLTKKVEAAQFIEELVRTGDERPPTTHDYCRLAKAQETLGQIEEAARLWSYLSKQSTLTAAEAWEGCAFLLRAGYVSEATYRLLCRVSLQTLRHASVTDLIRCAYLCQEVKDTARAKQCLALAIEQAPRSAELWREVMVFYYHAQSKEDAIEACRKVLQYGTEEMLSAHPDYLEVVRWMQTQDGGTP